MLPAEDNAKYERLFGTEDPNIGHLRSQRIRVEDCLLCKKKEPLYLIDWDGGGADFIHESQLVPATAGKATLSER